MLLVHLSDSSIDLVLLLDSIQCERISLVHSVSFFGSDEFRDVSFLAMILVRQPCMLFSGP